MGLFDIFKRKPPIRDSAALGDFIDANAALLTQKGIYEYSRARAGHYSKVLFSEQVFKTAVDESRWRAYPLGLAMVAEVADSVLHAERGGHRQQGLEALRALVLSVFDRYPTPPSLGVETWRLLRAELERRLKLIGTHPPKRAKDMPAPFARDYFALMPIHEKLRGNDYPTMASYLSIALTTIHDELSARLDRAAFAQPEPVEDI